METASTTSAYDFLYNNMSLKTKDSPVKKLELKVATETVNLCEYDPPSPCYSSQTDNEPQSPDSGFSSDENASPLTRRESRSNTLPSALRRSRSKACSKRVRFADTLGLDLEIRQYFTEKESNPFPTPPSSPTSGHRLVLSNFVYRTESEYNRRALEQMVCLAKLSTHGRTINGQINVANIAFAKEVAIRYTTDNWTTFDEVAASYGHNVFGANNVDAFVFSLMLPANIKDGKCQFCVRFTVNGSEFWDNNSGANFHVNVVAETISSTTPEYIPITHCLPETRTAASSFFTPRRLRRWGRAQEESDNESSRVYIPRRRKL